MSRTKISAAVPRPDDQNSLVVLPPVPDQLKSFVLSRVPAPFPVDTDFGLFIAPVVSQAASLTDGEELQVPEDIRNGADLSAIALTPHDIFYMMTDKCGNSIRQTFIPQHFSDCFEHHLRAAWAESEFDVESAAAIFRKLVNVSIQTRYGETRDKEKQRLAGICAVHKEIIGPLAGEIEVFACRYFEDCTALIISEFRRVERESPEVMRKFLSDPGHAFGKFRMWGQVLLSYGGAEVEQPPRLAAPASFLLVENEMADAFWESSLSISGITWYTPEKACSSGEEALALMEEAVSQGNRLPDFILTDIELSEHPAALNGLDLIEKIATLARGSSMPAFFVYSHNLEAYRERINALIARGLIKRAWQKSDVRSSLLVDTINECSRVPADLSSIEP